MCEYDNKPKILAPSSSYSFAKGQCDCVCDCACAPVVSSKIMDFNQGSLWKQSESLSQNLLPDYDIILPIDGMIGAVVLNRSAASIFKAFTEAVSIEDIPTISSTSIANDIAQITDRLFLLGLIAPFSNCLPTNYSSTPEILTAWLHLTDRCNFRCSYCYLPHVHEDMSFKTGQMAIDAAFRSALKNGFKQVKLKYAGGEPLLCFSLIVELHRYAQILAEKHGLGLDGVVLSNGTLLTVERAKMLKLLGLRLMISVDGLGKFHDIQRPYVSGLGTFMDVAKAIDLAIANGLIPDISVTVSNYSSEGLPEIMGWILERNLPFSLNFYRENELSASQIEIRLDEQKIIKGMLATFKVIENNLPRRPFLGGIVDLADLSAAHTHTCGAGQNYLVFDQNGQVAKCQMHIRKSITDVNAEDPLALIRADQIDVQNLPVQEKEGCKTCEWKHWCAGGCPLATYRATGRYDVKSPNCNIYKALFPEALRLEGLRLLKYQDDPEVVMAL